VASRAIKASRSSNQKRNRQATAKVARVKRANSIRRQSRSAVTPMKRAAAKAQSMRVAYELHSLGWKAFQDLALALCSEIWGQTVQGFVETHDGGRDGAFYGKWRAARGVTYKGSFTVQCKFTANPNKALKVSDLTDELAKARRLAKQGLADNYFIVTNARLTGTAEAKIRARFRRLPKLKHCVVFGYDRVCQVIRESSRLRMMVPRIYGIGDLSQILDERSYEQAGEIISSLGDDCEIARNSDPLRGGFRVQI
jgi:hypothetical protein